MLSTVVATVRSVAAYVLVLLYVLVAAPLGIVVTLIIRRSHFLYWLGRQGCRIGLTTAGIRYRVTGQERLRREQAPVYCVNHASNIEPPIIYMALAAVHPRLRILYKAEIHRIPVLSTVFDMAGFVPIQRRSREQSRKAIDLAASGLRGGNSFLVFPEGTRSRTGDLLPFKKGGFVMAIRGRSAVVPLVILGSHDAMRKGSPIIRPVTISVRIGESLASADYGLERRDDLSRETRARMEALIAEGPVGPRDES